MHRIVCFCHFLLLFLCVFCSPAFSNQELPLNNDGSLVSVEYVGVNPPIESIKNDLVSSEILLGDVALSLSATLFGTDPTVEHAFLLRPEKELLLEFLQWMDILIRVFLCLGNSWPLTRSIQAMCSFSVIWSLREFPIFSCVSRMKQAVTIGTPGLAV